MASFQLIDGLIGTASAVACVYYVRRGSLAIATPAVARTVPWHSALGDYALKNPFAAVFGALALGFLFSSWSVSALQPDTPLAPPRVVERWRTVTRTVSVQDPAQSAKIAALQTTLSSETATIAAQNTELERLKKLLGRAAFSRRERAHAAETDATAAPTPGLQTQTGPSEPPAASRLATEPAPALPAAKQGNGPADQSTAAATPGAPPADSAGAVPH